MKIIETERLILRTWQKEDVIKFFQINQDPKVIEFLSGSLTIDQVNDFIFRANDNQKKYGYASWSVELKDTKECIGFIGLNQVEWESHFTPAIEIGWRLGSQYWGKGYASEGAKAVLDYGFNKCGLKEIVSFTVPMNKASIRVMEKIGMHRNFSSDFFHPKLPLDHEYSLHVLYIIKK